MTVFYKMKNDQILIGEIKGAHGVKGLVRIKVYVENTDLFNTLTNPAVTLKNRHKGDLWLADVKGVTEKNGADALRGTQLYCDRSAMPELSDEEIYFADMVGMECVDEDGTMIGTVITVDNFGAGDLIEIAAPNGKNFYISYDDKTVLGIDDVIKVALPKII